jgi:hypothetical protein
VFTADARSMYTNIETNTGIDSIRNFLCINKENLPTNFPSYLLLNILEIVMRNNIFSFADTYWLQLCGTVMGTPVACTYASLTFGHFENTILLPTFNTNLICHYINDNFGIWLPFPTDALARKNFKQQLNNWGNLEWTVEEPSTQTHFLDLNINIKQSPIIFSTYRKPLNLYLYISPLSTHPASCLKGLIRGN